MTFITIDTNSPERGWPPFLEWLANQGVDPTQVKSVTFDPDSLDAEVVVHKLRDGKLYVEDGEDGEIATEARKVELSSLPPRRAADTAD